MSDDNIALPSTLRWSDADAWWPTQPDWMAEGACRGLDPNIFFGDPSHDVALVALAKEACAECPVRDLCLEHAITHKEFGVWGGKTENERRQIRRERRRQGDLPRREVPITHGTDTGYNRGCREHCCREAHRVAERLRRDQRAS